MRKAAAHWKAKAEAAQQAAPADAGQSADQPNEAADQTSRVAELEKKLESMEAAVEKLRKAARHWKSRFDEVSGAKQSS